MNEETPLTGGEKPCRCPYLFVGMAVAQGIIFVLASFSEIYEKESDLWKPATGFMIVLVVVQLFLALLLVLSIFSLSQKGEGKARSDRIAMLLTLVALCCEVALIADFISEVNRYPGDWLDSKEGITLHIQAVAARIADISQIIAFAMAAVAVSRADTCPHNTEKGTGVN